MTRTEDPNKNGIDDAPTDPDVGVDDRMLGARLDTMKFVRLDEGSWWDEGG